jgi:hypothetical protein
MRLNAPKKTTWWTAFFFLLIGGISFILSVLGIIGCTCHLDVWAMFTAAVLLAMGTTLRGF